MNKADSRNKEAGIWFSTITTGFLLISFFLVTMAASDKDNNNINQVKQLLSNLVDIGLSTLNSPNTISPIQFPTDNLAIPCLTTQLQNDIKTYIKDCQVISDDQFISGIDNSTLMNSCVIGKIAPMKYGQPDSFRLIQLISNGTVLSPGLKTNATKAMQDCMKASMEVTDMIASIVTDDNDLNSRVLNYMIYLMMNKKSFIGDATVITNAQNYFLSLKSVICLVNSLLTNGCSNQ